MTRLALGFGLAVLVAAGGAVPARAAPKAFACTAPKDVIRLNARLANTARAIRRGDELVIVALGSSSTEGVGASDRAHTYPARLARELRLRWPNLKLRVINSGVGGETADQMLARFNDDVMAYRPQLVIWQVGSNSVVRSVAMDRYVATVRKGIARLKAAGADVVLMDPQYAPVVVAKPLHQRMVNAMHALANDLKVGLFQRYAVMRHWVARGGVPMEQIVSRDRLHMNDASYGCIARLLADAVTSATREPPGLLTERAP